jgi:uncharacterized protein (TIGR02271 family)
MATDLVNLRNQEIPENANLEDYDAYDGNDNKLGGIDSVIADQTSMRPLYLVVDSGGWFSSKKFVVPIGEVSSVDDDRQRVYFQSLTKDALESGRYPQYNEDWWDTNNGQGFSGHERELAGYYGQQGRSTGVTAGTMREAAATEAGRGDVDYNDRLYQAPSQGAQRLQLMQEHLVANKERFQAGEVKVGKRITQHTETLNVPVREERVIIERTPATGQANVAGRELREGETIEVPVMKERVNVGKEAEVAEEVNVRKEAVQRTERVQDTVRREELDVKDTSGQVVDRTGGADDGQALPRGNGNVQRRMTDGETEVAETDGLTQERNQVTPPRP